MSAASSASRASAPSASAWVSANAGSGKTFVLAQRVKRLLLAGVKPDRILCLTFTKAAAANMANRVLVDLARWAAVDEQVLREELGLLHGRPVSRAEIGAARRIFAAALETPGGLKIQTIHAFCDALLHQFPLEAGVPASFRELDEAGAAHLRAESRRAVLREAAADEGGPLGAALAHASLALAERDFVERLDELLDRRDGLAALLPTLGDADTLLARIRAALDVPAGLTAAHVEARILSEAHFAAQHWAEAAVIFEATGGKQDAKCAAKLRAVLAATEGSPRAAAYRAFFLNAEGNGFLAASKLCTKAVAEAAPWLKEALEADRERLIELDRLAKALHVAHTSHALLVLARAASLRVEQGKREHGLLDFDDLVTRALALLSSEAGAWVRWKLDRGIDHVLVDEAQDTSAEQWAIIRALTDDFFAGESAADAPRTVFAVGDEKQSIFSFQGAAPAEFARQRARFERLALDAGRAFHNERLVLSYRSTTAVLSAVDAVFESPAARAGLSVDDEPPVHQSNRPTVPGLVEIWPVEARPEAADADGWGHPFAPPETRRDPRVALAQRIAGRLREAIGRDMVHDRDGTRRPLRAGDVMILVRRRGPLFEALIRALKAAGVPVAGADRLKLAEHIAVMDLLALGEAVLMPQDDLSFATVLKSPLLGLDEDDLFALAHGRGGALHATLAARAHEKPRWRDAHERFERWRARADRVRPYEFYAGVLGADGGRRAFAARLGREANDALDEFLAQALAHEQTTTPSLRGFIARLREAGIEVKREMEQGRDEARVMTAHNAKGLEAKLVILPDTTTLPGNGRPPAIHEIAPERAGAPPLLLWSPAKAFDVGPLSAARELTEAARLEEYRRLLYVALTRAEEHLILCGVPGGRRQAPDPNSWFALIEAALCKDAEIVFDADGTLRAYVRRHGERPASEGAPVVPSSAVPVPPWALAPPPPPPRAPAILAPSRAPTEDRAPRRGSGDGVLARARGEALHRLLQSLPDIAPHRREEIARRFAEQNLPELAEEIAREALAVLADPALAPFLAADALAEVPVAGEIELPDGARALVSGRIDRLAVMEDRVAILDYKTGEVPPPGATPQAYVAQLALYARVLQGLWPGRTVSAHLLWTRAPRLDALSPEALAAALARLRPEAG